MKYMVEVKIINVKERGEKDLKEFDFTFQEESIINSRNKAIAKYLELENEFLNGETEYYPLLDAMLKGYKSFNSYSLNLVFAPNGLCDYFLCGINEECTIDALQAEAYHYAKKDNIGLTEIKNNEGKWIQVIDSNLDFLLNKNITI
ncbi:hypothetical protein SAMN03097699_0605 [Flavobacteriaceae bacterium MAR_2010_188]|nr:hypothetical protein SAMN03097699_0605 [Flavobacteriaceae bacterium MAR_2010_188]